MIERRQARHDTARYIWLLVGWLLFLLSQPHSAFAGEAKAASPSKAVVGAIRWDAWFGGNTYQRNLAPPTGTLDFLSTPRLPLTAAWRCDLTASRSWTRKSPMPKLRAWAIGHSAITTQQVGRGPTSTITAGDSFFPVAERLTFDSAFLLQGQHLGPKAKWTETVQSLVGLLKDPTYQKVCGDRPLVFVYSVAALHAWAGSRQAAKEAILELRQAAVNAGAGNIYLVAQVYRTEDGVDTVDELGFDAISAYSLPGGAGNREYPFQELAKANRSFWDACKATGKPVVPIVNAGWDNRPRRGNPAFGDLAGPWFTEPTPAELADHLGSAIRWNRANFQNAPANTVIVYAWNESDEGGWLVPTRSEGAARLNAIAKLLRPSVSQRATVLPSAIR